LRLVLPMHSERRGTFRKCVFQEHHNSLLENSGRYGREAMACQ
jgi:hypothetical protein